MPREADLRVRIVSHGAAFRERILLPPQGGATTIDDRRDPASIACPSAIPADGYAFSP